MCREALAGALLSPKPADGETMASREKHDSMANAIRFLSADAVERANSGHPGLPMGAADIATVLFTRFLKYDPKNPHWPDRDRFILSAGHGSMLLYGLLHLAGFDCTLDDLKRPIARGIPVYVELTLTPYAHPEGPAARITRLMCGDGSCRAGDGIVTETELKYDAKTQVKLGDSIPATGEIDLPERANGKVYWMQPKYERTDGSVRWGDAIAIDAARAKGLQLSRIDGRWRLGTVQAWWLRYDELLSRRTQFAGWREFETAERKLLDEFPACTSSPAETSNRLAAHQVAAYYHREYQR